MSLLHLAIVIEWEQQKQEELCFSYREEQRFPGPLQHHCSDALKILFIVFYARLAKSSMQMQKKVWDE